MKRGPNHILRLLLRILKIVELDARNVCEAKRSESRQEIYRHTER